MMQASFVAGYTPNHLVTNLTAAVRSTQHIVQCESFFAFVIFKEQH